MNQLELNLTTDELKKNAYLIVPSLYNTEKDNNKLIKKLNDLKNVDVIKQLQKTKMISIIASDDDIKLIQTWKEVLTITENTIPHV